MSAAGNNTDILKDHVSLFADIRTAKLAILICAVAFCHAQLDVSAAGPPGIDEQPRSTIEVM